MTDIIVDWDADRLHAREVEGDHGINPARLVTTPDLDILRWYLEIFPTRGEKAARNRATRIEKLFAAFTSRLNAQVPSLAPVENLRIISNRPSIHELPWELIEESASFPLTSAVVRGFTNKPVVPASAAVALKILLVVSRPGAEWDVPPLAVARSLASLQTIGVGAELLLKATLASLESTLTEARARGEPFSVVQFDVHGGSRKDGLFGIVLEKQDGKKDWIPAAEIARILKGSGVRVVVTNACRSGRSVTGQPNGASLPAALLNAGIPAVIAMAYDLRADAAPIFTAAFYGALAHGESLIKAIRSARSALQRAPQRRTRTGFIDLADWWTPVAYVHDDVLFVPTATDNVQTSNGRKLAASDMQATEHAAYQILASLLRGRNIVIGGFKLGGQWLGTDEALRVYGSLKPRRRVLVLRRGLNRTGNKLAPSARQAFADMRPEDLVVVGVENVSVYRSARDLIEEIGALSKGQLVIVTDSRPPVVPSFDIVTVANIESNDIPYLLVDRHVKNYDFVDDVLRGRLKIDMLRLFASPAILMAFRQASRTQGLEKAEEEIRAALAGRGGGRTILATVIRATVARFDWNSAFTILAGLMPSCVSETLFRHCATTIDAPAPLEDWVTAAEASGFLIRSETSCNFHPLLGPALLKQAGIDPALREQTVAGFISATAGRFCEDLAAFDDLRAPSVIAAAAADADCIENAVLLVLTADFLGETRWRRFASPLLEVLLVTRGRRGEYQALALFAERCWPHLKHDDRRHSEDEQAFWIRLAKDHWPDHVEVRQTQPDAWQFLLGIELIVRQLVGRREFTRAEAQVRHAIDMLGRQPPAMTHRLYGLVAEIGERRGWPVMAQKARKAASSVFEEVRQPVPIAIEARRILADTRHAFFAHVAGGRAMRNIQNIDDLPARLVPAELHFRTLRSSADLCDLLVLTVQIKVRLGQPAAAISKAEEAVKFADRMLDDWRKTLALLALGDAYLAMFAIESARLYYSEAAGCAERLGDNRLAAATRASSAETSFLLGRTPFNPYGFSAYQEMENAYRKLAEWAATEAPHEAVRQSGGVLAIGTTAWTASQELEMPTPEMLRVTDITRRFVEGDATGETLHLIEIYIDTLRALEPYQSAIIFLRILHDRLRGIGRTTPEAMIQIVRVSRKLPTNHWPVMLPLLTELAETVLQRKNPDLWEAMIQLLHAHTDLSSDHGTALKEQSNKEWILARYHLAHLLLESDNRTQSLIVTKEVVNQYLPDDDPNAGVFMNIYGTLLWFDQGNGDAAIAAWTRSRELKMKAGQNTESVDWNLDMARSSSPPPPRSGNMISRADGSDLSEIATDVAKAVTPTDLVTIRNSWRAEQRTEVKAALADAFLDRLDVNPDGLAAFLLHFGQNAASELTDLGDPHGAEVRLNRCVDMLPHLSVELPLRQRIFSNRSYARQVQNERESARADAAVALEIITRQDYPADDRLPDFAIAWGNRFNAALNDKDRLADAVEAVATIDAFKLWAQAGDIMRNVRLIIRALPRHAFEEKWRDRFHTELPESVRLQLGEVL